MSNNAEMFPRATLFQVGQFFLHSGQATNWKIEADALTDEDWRGLAAMAVDALRVPYGPGILYEKIIGVPRGGAPFAAALQRYLGTVGGSERFPRLIVDDVLTTGASMQAAMDRPDDIGLVVFARGRPPLGVIALFTMPVTYNGT